MYLRLKVPDIFDDELSVKILNEWNFLCEETLLKYGEDWLLDVTKKNEFKRQVTLNLYEILGKYYPAVVTFEEKKNYLKCIILLLEE